MKNFDSGLVAGILSYLTPLAEENSNHDIHLTNLKKILEKHGFTVLGRGSYRVAVTHKLLPDLVFKLAISEESENMSLSEWELYNVTATETERSFLAATYHANAWVSVGEFVRGVLQYTRGSIPEARWGESGIQRFYRGFNRANYDDLHGANFVLREGDDEPILIDYAIN